MKYLSHLFCYLGWHSWKYNLENFKATGGVVTIAWKQCEECAHSKLTMILR